MSVQLLIAITVGGVLKKRESEIGLLQNLAPLSAACESGQVLDVVESSFDRSSMQPFQSAAKRLGSGAPENREGLGRREGEVPRGLVVFSWLQLNDVPAVYRFARPKGAKDGCDNCARKAKQGQPLPVPPTRRLAAAKVVFGARIIEVVVGTPRQADREHVSVLVAEKAVRPVLGLVRFEKATKFGEIAKESREVRGLGRVSAHGRILY